MTYMVEWQATAAPSPALQGVVSYVRMFRSVTAVKSFMRSRTITSLHDPELRVTLRRSGYQAGPVMTNIRAILAWDSEAQELPPVLLRSRWERQLQRIATAHAVTTAIERALESAQAVDLLTDADARQILRLLHQALERAR